MNDLSRLNAKGLDDLAAKIKVERDRRAKARLTVAPAALLAKLEYAEVDAKLEPDTRQMMREERIRLSAALQAGDGQRIADAHAEALRVAGMWGVSLT